MEDHARVVPSFGSSAFACTSVEYAPQLFGIITSHFRVGRHLYSASGYRVVMKSRFVGWEEVIHVEAIVGRAALLEASLRCER
jgi:hypothetical protein